MSTANSFRVGDKVVYPNHGVGVIEHIRPAEVGDGTGFYLLHIEANNLRVMVPLANAESVGMRRVADAAELLPVLGYLESTEQAPCAADWKERFRLNADKMRNGAPAQVAEVVKSLVQLHQRKPLSFREKKMLDRAVVQFSAELASVNAISSDEAMGRMRDSLRSAGLELPELD